MPAPASAHAPVLTRLGMAVAAVLLAAAPAMPGRAAPPAATETRGTAAGGPAASGLVVAATAPAAVPAPTSPPAPPAAGMARPRLGLVLGGGGARGAAHIGVLEVLEALRVPVDCVAGTSMGALVAGAWAAGVTTGQMRAEWAQADWADMFQDNPGWDELNFRTKRLAQRFLPGSETGLQGGAAVAPPGMVSGQKIKLFFNHLVRADTGEPQIEALRLPVSLIATDIGTGERVVFRDGSLTQAMRASMSVPGLMAPLEYRGRKLVDGGLVDNVPVREVRDRCGAQAVIVVNVGSPPLRPDQVSGLLSITAQMVALLTEQNVSQSLASLGPRDVYIKPELGDITAGDFSRHAEAVERGRAAAQALADQLRRYAVDEPTYAAWRRRLADEGPVAPPRIDEVQVAGLLRGDEELVRRHLRQREGAPLDTKALQRDLLRAFGDGYYESVDYSVLRRDGRNILRVQPIEKGWGPDYLRLGLKFDSSIGQGSTYQLRAAFHRTWLNRLGGELLVAAELGSTTGLSAEFMQPLSADQRWFVDVLAEHRSERTDYYFGEQRVAEYATGRSRLELTGGRNLGLLGQWRLGWRESRVFNSLETGLDIFAPLPERRHSGWLMAFDLDQQDRLVFPRRGWAAQASWFGSADQRFDRLALEGRLAWPQGGWVLGTRASWVGAVRGRLPVSEAGRLGGFLNLTGFANGQLLGDDVAYAHLRAERIFGSLPLGLRGDMRWGVAVELGRVGQPYALQKRDGTLWSLATYVGGETPFGPVYLGVGQGSGRAINAYLFIGTP